MTWPRRRLKFCVDLCREPAPDTPDIPLLGLEHVESATGRLAPDSEPAGGEGGLRFHPGDVLFGKLRPYLAKAWLADRWGRCSSEFLVLRSHALTPRFLRYWILSKEFVETVDASTFGTKMPRADWEFIGNVPTPIPPTSRQEGIADFLDRETARIDAALSKNRSVLDLVAEKRESLVSELVMRGVRDVRDRRSSGIWFIGDIPMGWRVIRLKFLGQVRSGIALGRNFDGPLTTPYLRVANVQNGYLRLEDLAALRLTPAEVERFRLRYGDVLMNEGGDFDKLGRGTVWRDEVTPCVHQNHVFAIRLRTSEDAAWIALLTQARYARFYFAMKSKQSTNLASISATNIGEFPVLWPTPGERSEILDAIRIASQEAESQAALIRRQVTLLTEYRSALITAAVTGQLSVG